MSTGASSIAANVARVQERIARAAEHCGRKPEEVTLVAVAKTFPAEAIREAYAAGVRHFGENRVQEWAEKQPLLADLDATWHLVGHLQSNKARRAAELFHTIDSLDSLSLAQKLDAIAAELGKRLPVLIEVHLSPETTKSGVSEAELPALAEAVMALPHLDLRGLMTMPPFFDDPERVRPYFRKLRQLRDALRSRLAASPACHSERSPGVPGRSEESLLPELSMGMTHDFEIAIEEGATQVRLGTAIFGERAPRRPE